MITDVDKRIMNINNDDDDLDIYDQVKPNLYNMKKDICIDWNNMGVKSFKDSCKL